MQARPFTVPLLKVYKSKSSLTNASKRDALVYDQEQLDDVGEYAYLVTLSVGGQQFPVIFDTGSSDLWVVSISCTDEDCQKIKKYAPSQDLVLTTVPFNLDFLTGSVSGSVGYEVVTFGPFEVFQQVLALANSTVNMGLTPVGASGILGLAFGSEAAISPTVGATLLSNIFANLEPQSQFIAYKLGSNGHTSSFSIGELDPTYVIDLSHIFFSPVFSSPGTNYDYWKLPLKTISVNSVPFPVPLSPSKLAGTACPIAVLDTGTTLILGPSHDVDNLWTVIGSSRKGSDGMWQVRCEHGAQVQFIFGNDTINEAITLDPADVSWLPGGNSDGWCLGGIQANDNIHSGDWLLGDVFLRSAYVIHAAATTSSPPSIGLLGTTNATEALALFSQTRGQDPCPSAVFKASILYKQGTSTNVKAVLAASTILAFIGSSILSFLFQMVKDKPKGRAKMVQ